MLSNDDMIEIDRVCRGHAMSHARRRVRGCLGPEDMDEVYNAALFVYWRSGLEMRGRDARWKVAMLTGDIAARRVRDSMRLRRDVRRKVALGEFDRAGPGTLRRIPLADFVVDSKGLLNGTDARTLGHIFAFIDDSPVDVDSVADFIAEREDITPANASLRVRRLRRSLAQASAMQWRGPSGGLVDGLAKPMSPDTRRRWERDQEQRRRAYAGGNDSRRRRRRLARAAKDQCADVYRQDSELVQSVPDPACSCSNHLDSEFSLQ